MIEVLKFIFTGFWHWLGSVILIAAIAGMVSGAKLIEINNYRKEKEK